MTGRCGAGPPLALTMGEPAGIGSEIAFKAWLARGERSVPPFLVIADPEQLERDAATLGLSVPLATIEAPEDIVAAFARALPVLPQRLVTPATLGRLDPANAEPVLAAIRRAVSLAGDGKVGAVVTNPIQKQTLYQAGFHHPGHTEYLAELAGATRAPVMLLACPGLRVVPVTIHLALREAVARLDTRAIIHAGIVTAEALARDFAVARPRLAVAGLNPHAGEGGALGREEIEVIAPAVEALRAEGIAVAGPAPADTLFHAAARTGYDAALCMYHDQALIPLKTIDFERGVNVTLGLPFVRTSPDHGTAVSIAGRGTASPTSLIAALQLAAEMAAARQRTDNAG